MLDLVTPWGRAVADGDPAMAAFRQEHALLLERVRQYQAPHLPILPLDTVPPPATAAVAACVQATEQVLARASAQGLRHDALPVFLPLRAILDPFLAIPGDPPLVLLNPDAGPLQVSVTLARGLALVTRWGWSRSAVSHRTTPWERAAVDPLRVAIYAHGLAWHAAQALHQEPSPARLFGVSAAAWQRLREREHRGRAALAAMLDQPGLGPLLAWLPADAGVGSLVPTLGAIPPRFGHYLAWRMTAQRVARLGLLDALRAVA